MTERLEEIRKRTWIHVHLGKDSTAEMPREDMEYLQAQAERTEELESKYKNLSDFHNVMLEKLIEVENRNLELEKERNDWKGKHSILKRKYKGLQRKMDNRWRYNRAVENESRANKAVLEEFRDKNQRYRQALEFYADYNNYKLSAEAEKADLTEFISVIDKDSGAKARQELNRDK